MPRAVSAGLLLTVPLLACAPARSIPSDPRPAYAHDSCAPWDGGAVRILLGEGIDTARVFQSNPAPGLELAVYTGIENALGRKFRVDAEARTNDGTTGGARWCDEGGECVALTEGVIRLERVTDDSSVVGSSVVTLPDGSRMRTRFAARWLSTPALCG